jgi:four helix bundle protein
MAKIEKFEDILAWQNSMALCNDIYDLTYNENFIKDFALREQIRKSAISIPSNIAEGFERGSNIQFKYFLTIAKASAGELRTQIYIAKNLKYISEKEFEIIINKCNDVSKLISKFISYLRNNEKNNNNTLTL